MAGINFLHEEYRKDPKRIEKLLNENIEIIEKLDGSRFQVQKDDNLDLSFYKRKDVPISKIDRTLSKYYEKAIFHFESFSSEKLSQLPEGWRFGMEYFPNLHPVTIAYDRLPLNNLVLTDIQVKDPKDRTVEVISDKKTLNRWAEILEIEKPPIVFEGKLDEKQKKKILEFLNTQYSELVNRFKTENFTYFILSLLNKDLKSSFLNNDLQKDIDGLVFKFNGKETYRVSNPEIAIRKIEKKNEKPSDIYNLTLVFIQEFVTSLDLTKIKLKQKTFEERYIELISSIYNKFLQTSIYRENFEKGVDFELPKFLTQSEANVNFAFVKDQITIENLNKSSTNRELFKILLASMRSRKKKPSGFFTKELVYYHNELVDKIADYVSEYGNIKEASFFSFKEFKSVYLNESEHWPEEFGKEKTDDVEDVSFLDSSDETNDEEEKPEFPTFSQVARPTESKNRAIDILNKICEDEDEENDAESGDKVCVVKGKFHPFHNGHKAICEDAEKASGMKVFLVISNKKLKNVDNQDLHKQMIEDVIKSHPSICGYTFSNGLSMSEISKDIPKSKKIGSFAGSKEECEDAKNQLGKDFPAYNMTQHISTNSIMQKIKNEDIDGYKKLVPEELHNYFYKLKNEITED